ncbi:putative transporter [Corynebacterium kalinowskii]|uniref:Transporter n=2 Tax=Corynebacterium kalinowskii TaxID=2675216 RepID=A0A6B8VRT5_9CORY|nr:putative transporter [Corynebacterium kalinowskii]
MARNRRLSREELDQLPSMWSSPGFLATIVAVAAAFGSWSLLLPVVPLAVISSGGSDAYAGATTGVFMAATVLTQIFTPRLCRMFGYIPVMSVSAFLLGAPALGYLFSMDPLPVLLISALRGVGFGALTVAESALIAELVPLRFLGKASGMLGLSVGLSELIFLPVGLYLAEQVSFASVYVLGAIVALIAAVMCLLIPRIKPEPKGSPAAVETQAAPVATWKLVTVPAIGICVASMGFGVVSTFLPAAVREADAQSGALYAGIVLSIVGGAQMVFRYLAGVVADRRGTPGASMAPALLAGAFGLALMAVTVANGWSVWLLFFAAVFYGGGFGAAQNEALLEMFTRLPRSRVSEASAIWNIAFDSGTGIGSFALGLVAATYAYSGAFAAAAGLMALGLVATLLDALLGRHRISETDNSKERLRRVRPVRPLRPKRKRK